MRTILSLFILVLLGIQVLAQAKVPNSFSYQAVLRDAEGDPMANQSVNVNVKIYAGPSSAGDLLFIEDHSGVNTNPNGLFSITIGWGDNQTHGSLMNINWSNMYSTPPYLVVEVLGMQMESMMNSVPFAMYSHRVQYYNEADPIFGNSPASSITNSGSGSVITTVERAGLHTHTNSGVLNAITNAGSGEIITLSERDGLHIHANEDVLDEITDAGSGEIISVSERDGLHIHANEDVLDEIANAGSGSIITTEERAGLHAHANSEVLNAISHAGSGQIITNAERTKLDNVVTYSIGDFAHGGVVFYVEPCGTKGLVAAIEDQNGGSTIKWRGGETNYYTNAQAEGIYAGHINTSIIISVHSAKGDFDEHAAKVCLHYAEGGYGDWYLPSQDELNDMYSYRDAINSTAVANGGVSFASDAYWSSTENTTTDGAAIRLNFVDGELLSSSKANHQRVRAIRRF